MKTEAPPALWQPPVWICFAWGLAEATFFFLIPDIVLSWAALGGLRNGIRALVAILAGSLVGGFFMYQWASRAPDASRTTVARVPFVRKAMFANVEQGYTAQGLPAMLRGPGSGIPYKIYAVLAPPAGGLPSFLLLSVPARLERLALSWLGFTALGLLLRNRIRTHRPATTVIFLAFWSVVYAFYWGRL